MSNSAYANNYRDIDFRKHPEKYKIGRGEQGVLIAEPYKSEILPHWKFANLELATESAKKIYALFCEYKLDDDFVGMDMSRKFLQMGFTRARRYANHPSGRKYQKDKSVIKQADDWKDSEKAQAAKVFHEYYRLAKLDQQYRKRYQEHRSSGR